MNSKEYVKNVLITETRDLTPVRERLQVDKNIRLIHACAGIASEIAEIVQLLDRTGMDDKFDRVNLMEECGDIFWYIGVAADALESTEILEHNSFAASDFCKHDDDLWGRVFNTTNVLTNLSGSLQDLAIKKLVFYGKKVSHDDLIEILSEVHAEIQGLLQTAGYTVEQARERNIAKLKARYGEKFTEAAALDRDLDTERKILEGK